jgi:N-acetylneuraminic acid mutarotase
MKKLFIFFMLLSLRICAAAQELHLRPLEDALNPDGTLRSGIQGLFQVEGYAMHFGQHGEPIFLRCFSKLDTARTDTARTDTVRTFGTGGNGVSGLVRALVVIGNEVYVGGNFTEVNVGSTPVPANNVACFNVQTNTWRALASNTGNGVNGEVFALAVSGSVLYVGGEFTQANAGSSPIAANNVAYFDLQRRVWSPLSSNTGNGVNGQVFALAVAGYDVYVGGEFTQANVGKSPLRVNCIARFNTGTNTWSKLGTTGIDGTVYALAVSGSDLYAGGAFTRINTGKSSITANYVARFNTSTNTWSILGTGNGVDGTVNALSIVGSEVYVSGYFTHADILGSSVPTNRVARFNTASKLWRSL